MNSRGPNIEPCGTPQYIYIAHLNLQSYKKQIVFN